MLPYRKTNYLLNYSFIDINHKCDFQYPEITLQDHSPAIFSGHLVLPLVKWCLIIRLELFTQTYLTFNSSDNSSDQAEIINGLSRQESRHTPFHTPVLSADDRLFSCRTKSTWKRPPLEG